jgi:hypothetical protein
MSHYPNPFDFVPFPAAPILRTEEQFDALGEKLSGYLELEIKALTPVHVVGKVEGGTTEHRSFFYQQDGQPCIPASSIRGCLRAFTEALTAGWVSKATPEYEKVYGLAPGAHDRGRHIGFRTFDEYPNDRPSVHHRVSPPAVNPAFRPGSDAGRLDVASYLFGVVVEGKQAEHEEQARKSKLWVEDAYFAPEALVHNGDLWAPDIAGTAFMGGAKPSASNWWYFEPTEVWQRRLPFGVMAEFVGERFRGRKFYYHQPPAACVRMYHPTSNFWNYAQNRFHPVRLECMRQDTVTQPFRLYLDGVPLPLFQLLLHILLPGDHIRHKLGYAKAYGYGSLEIVLRSARLRIVSTGIPRPLKAMVPSELPAGDWSQKTLEGEHLTDLVDRNALRWLARILGWPHGDLLFLYPRYRAQEFQQAIRYSQFNQKMAEHHIPVGGGTQVTPHNARAIAEALFELKRPLDFRLYQERAEGWEVIKQRQP